MGNLVESLQAALDDGLLATPEPSAATSLSPTQPGLGITKATASALDMFAPAAANAIAAVNAVTSDEIKPRFRPVLTFYTRRKTMKVGRMLKQHGLALHKWKGKTCYSFECPALPTYEQAWAYAESFRKSVPDLDIHYGIRFTGEPRQWGYQMYDSGERTLVSIDEPTSRG